MPRKVFFALVSLGPAVAWMGIGLLAFPLTGEQLKKSFEPTMAKHTRRQHPLPPAQPMRPTLQDTMQPAPQRIEG